MAAFLIFSRETVTDEAKSRRYSELVVPQIRQFGGEMIVARGKTDLLEGDWRPHSVTLVKFESKAALMAWWDSPDYAPLKQMRQESNTGDIIVVEN